MRSVCLLGEEGVEISLDLVTELFLFEECEYFVESSIYLALDALEGGTVRLVDVL